MPELGKMEEMVQEATSILAKKSEIIDDLGKEFHEFKGAIVDANKDTRAEVQEIKERASAAMDKAEEAKDALDDALAKVNAANRLREANSDEALTEVEAKHRETFGTWMRKGYRGVAEHEIEAAEAAYIEEKQLSVDSGTDGGYLVHAEIDRNIRNFLREVSPMMRYASNRTTSLGSVETYMGIGGSNSGWVGERESRPETNTSKFKQTEINVYELYAQPAVTHRMLDDSDFNVEGFVQQEVAAEMAQTLNAAAVLGDQVKKPGGVAVPSLVTSGWDLDTNWGSFEGRLSGTDGALGADTATSVQNLIALTEDPKTGYLPNSRFFSNRAVRTEARQLLDADDRPLWEPSMQAGVPARFLGYEWVVLFEMLNSADATGVLFGDMSRAYQIVSKTGGRMLRDELTVKGKVLYYTTARFGGEVINYEALKGLKLGD